MEEQLMSEYIGKDAEKYMNTNTNWMAALLGQSIGPVWFFYRKSYLLGFAFIILTLIVGRVATSLGIKKAYYIMFLIYLFLANKLYLWDVRRKVKKILENNENMSQEQLVEIARKKGRNKCCCCCNICNINSYFVCYTLCDAFFCNAKSGFMILIKNIKGSQFELPFVIL